MRRTRFKPHLTGVALLLASGAFFTSAVAWAGGTVTCYNKTLCDKDGDGYAGWPPQDSECKREQKSDDGKKLCPKGYVQYSEPAVCDRVDETTRGKVTHYIRKLPNLAQTRKLERRWAAQLNQIHPRQRETRYNDLDDNCNGRVDEAEFDYEEFGRGIKQQGFSVRVRINDRFVRDYADYIGVHVFELAKLKTWLKEQRDDWKPNTSTRPYDLAEIKALTRGQLSYEHKIFPFPGAAKMAQVASKVAPTVVPPTYYPYGGTDELTLAVSGLPNASTVYVVSLAFYRAFVGGVDMVPIKCIDDAPGGIVLYTDDACQKFDKGDLNNFKNRITSNVYFTATEVVYLANGTSLVPGEERARRRVTNRGFYEWWLSEGLGQVGGPRGVIETTKWPDGTRYWDVDYGDLWCTEFVGTIYGWSLNDDDISDPSHVGAMVEYFEDMGQIWRGDAALHNLGGVLSGGAPDPDPARPGDYLAIDSYGGGKKTHSSLLVGTESTAHANAGVWRVGGNEDRQVKLTITDAYRYWEVDGNLRYYYQAVGHLSSERPQY